MAWDTAGRSYAKAHRRIVIRHLLKASGGLQIVQLVKQLRESGLCHAPMTKDLLKMDFSVMQKAGTVRRVGNSKKWELVEESARNHS